MPNIKIINELKLLFYSWDLITSMERYLLCLTNKSNFVMCRSERMIKIDPRKSNAMGKY